MYGNAKLSVYAGCLIMALSAACSKEGSESSPPSETTSVSGTDSSNACMEKIICDIEADSLKPLDRSDRSDPDFAKKNADYIWKRNECSRIRCREFEIRSSNG